MTYSVLKVPLNPNQPTNQPTYIVTILKYSITNQPTEILWSHCTQCS